MGTTRGASAMLAVLVGLGGLAIGCDTGAQQEQEATGQAEGTEQQAPEIEPAGSETEAEPSPLAGVDEAVAVIHPTEGNDVRGELTLTQLDEGVRVQGTVEGLEPGTTHGFHIHEFGDCSAPDATSAGGHYAPEGEPHGLPDEPEDERHAGDLGNIEANDEGIAEVDITVEDISLANGDKPVLGRAFIVHAKEDDGGQPAGNAGARLGCGTIAIAGES